MSVLQLPAPLPLQPLPLRSSSLDLLEHIRHHPRKHREQRQEEQKEPFPGNPIW
jgi:hypothetical protein